MTSKNLIFLVIAMFCIGTICSSQNYLNEVSPYHPFGKVNPNAPQALQDFSPMIGECKCKSFTRNQDQSWQDGIDMTWKWKYILDGMGVQDETLKNDGKHSGSIRQYIPDSSRWFVHYYSSATPSGSLGTWEGNKNKDGNIVLYRDQNAPNGMEGWYRLTFSEMSPYGYNWIGEWVDKAETIAFPTWKIECVKQFVPDTQLKSLIGLWKVQGKELYEEWQADGQGNLIGTSYVLHPDNSKEKNEDISILGQNGTMIYTATVADQNEGQTVPFYFDMSNTKEWVFSNEEHDFPKKLIYKILEDDRLFVKVLGEDNKGFSLYMDRVIQ